MNTEMPTMDEQIAQQYRASGNLEARIALHDRYSVNDYPWQRWVFDHLELPPRPRVLELGCGPGNLWAENEDRLPAGGRVVLTDYSAGMVEQARRRLGQHASLFAYGRVDAHALPFAGIDFNGVIANHMLYHVSDRDVAVAEMVRVLRPEGRLYASTVGERHMLELWDLVEALVPGARARLRAHTSGFTLENGRSLLERYLPSVRLYLYDDALVVTEAAPLCAYVFSSTTLTRTLISPEQRAAFTALVEARLSSQGSLRITKSTGLFVATRSVL